MTSSANASPQPGVKSTNPDEDLKKPEVNTRLVRSLLYHFEQRYDRATLEKLLSKTGLDRSYLDDDHNWVSLAYRDRLLNAMMEYSQDRRFAFKAGLDTVRPEVIGIGYHVLASFSRPRYLYKKLIDLAPLANKVGQFTILELTDQSLSCIYQPITEEFWDDGPGAEFRLGQLVAWPRLAKSSRNAEYEEKVIEVGGRRAYHYIFRWENPERSLLPLTGAALGALAGLLVVRSDSISGTMSMAGLLLLGTMVGVWLKNRKQMAGAAESIASQQEELYRQEERLEHRFNELKEQNTAIRKLNSELSLKIEALETASGEIRELNRNLEIQKETLQQRVEEQTRKLSERKAQLEVMNHKLRLQDQVKNQIFNRISHELRTPLTLILPPIQSMLSDVTNQLSKPHQQLLETMRNNAYRLMKLVNSLLDLAKTTEGKMKLRYSPTDLNDLLSIVVEAVRPATVQHRLELRTHFQEGLPSVHVDSEKIEQTVLNLLSNAVKFTPAGGAISVSTAMTDTHVQIRVRDTGHGIEKSFLSRIFDPFTEGGTEVERGYGGTGIGLSLVKQYVQNHNGQVEVTSEVGKGTQFTVSLPKGEGTIRHEAADRRRSASGVSQSRRMDEGRLSEMVTNLSAVNLNEFRVLESNTEYEPPPRVEGRPTLLIIDDEADVRGFLAVLLQVKYNILLASNRIQGEATARAELPDLILCDINMGTSDDGFNLRTDLKGDPATGEIPIILMSAVVGSEEGIILGADDFVTKPFNIFQLFARINNLLEKRELTKKLWRANRDLAEQKALVEQMAVTDPLTSLYNRRFLQKRSHELFSEAKKGNLGLGIIMIDIDHFKRFNTLHGHAGGDTVLRELARLLKQWVDEPGLAARYGGEEFSIILPGRNLSMTLHLAEALIHEVRQQRFDAVLQLQITLSMGIAALPESPAQSDEELLRLADEALMRAKHRRDCIRCEGDEAVTHESQADVVQRSPLRTGSAS